MNSDLNKEQSSDKIAFIHPDLGIGGAERLVVDAAVGLKHLGYKVTIYTSHCDKTHAFEEVSNGDLYVKVYGDFLPTNFLKKFQILFAIIRQFFLVVKLILTGEVREYDYFIVDQLSFCIPFLSTFGRADSRILFYCHFPDQLLTVKSSLLKRCYRLPFDKIEEWTTGISDKIIVNSNFTRGVFKRTFKSLANSNVNVIYPCVDISNAEDNEEDKKAHIQVEKELGDRDFFFSINRYERKKNIVLAIESYYKFKEFFLADQKREAPRLVVAGGYDDRVSENHEYLVELTSMCKNLNLKYAVSMGRIDHIDADIDVLFLTSIRSSLKKSLNKKAELLLYTPSFEHFGVVPVESMLFKTPVLTVNNGGPLESVISLEKDNEDVATGYSKVADPDVWAEVMYYHYVELDTKTKNKLTENGYKRAYEIFLREQMSYALEKNLRSASRTEKQTITKAITSWWFNMSLICLCYIIYKILF